MFTLNCRGRLFTMDEPVVMGIINATPDSFYEGSRKDTVQAAIETAANMLEQGAAIIDVGGQSTRPGSVQVGIDEECDRVLPVIEALRHSFPQALISIDTYYAKVAFEAVQSGAHIVNDISAGYMDDDMLPVVASLQTPYICMHMKGTPQNMQQQAVYDNVTREVLDFFIHRLDDCRKAGIHDIIVDPGFGFSKTIQHNFQLLHELQAFNMLKKPLLAGLSRKSTVYKTLGITAAEALNGTTALNTIALLNGAHILRVHDVKEAVECVQLIKAYRSANS